ncbi:Na/Pi symporter [Uruburuella testudinis]|uniref:Na/Pi symporter n=1 Tax=Uruburuella testudinis TaxID=1282863 RepID=A0ABY4DNU5_9NEIS|nr:Na/Pi symporter [Uruburuella testudinis]UOO80731.1 Na/Pi symporter [Uruburuella testudinis]
MKNNIRLLLAGLLLAALAYSFWYSAPWLQLCYGLALFLFGMQCIEEGLHNAAGGTLERMMAKSTATPAKGLLFGMGATFILQSSTLVSLLTIAFLSTGLISLAGGIAVILGTNLGATSGIWLLAAAGQSISLSPAAVPMLVFGILAGFFKGRAKPVGRVLVGIALIFIGIDAIKDGFQTVGSQVDLAAIQVSGIAEVAIFSGIGLLLTIVLQSSHATLILTLAALAGGQISLAQGFAIAIGSNVGSSISTAFVGMLGSERSGRRLALAHLLFNVVTAALSLLMWLPLTRLVVWLAAGVGLNPLLQLALFHTLFNLLGLAVFWRLQGMLAALLQRWLPDKAGEDKLLPGSSRQVRARYLSGNVLRSGDTAIRAVFQEIRHLSALSLEAICHVLFIPAERLYQHDEAQNPELPLPAAPLELDAQQIYERQIKPLYSELLDFISKMDIDGAQQQQQLAAAHMAVSQLMEIVKDSKHLQKNMQLYLQQPESSLYRDYLRLRRHLFKTLCLFRRIAAMPAKSAEWMDELGKLEHHIGTLETFRGRVMVKLRSGEIDGWQTSSLMNDSNYARRIGLGVTEVLHIAALELPKGARVLPEDM